MGKNFFSWKSLKHPKLWRKYFPSISIRDIVFTADIEILGMWSEVFPKKFWMHFREACIAVLPETSHSRRKRLEERLKGYFHGSAHAFLAAAQQAMWKFANRTLPQKFPHIVQIRPPTAFELLEVSGLWPTVPIGGVPTPVLMFPEKVQLKIVTAISKDMDFCRGEVEVDMQKMRAMAKPLISEIRKSAPLWEKEIRKTGKMLR